MLCGYVFQHWHRKTDQYSDALPVGWYVFCEVEFLCLSTPISPLDEVQMLQLNLTWMDLMNIQHFILQSGCFLCVGRGGEELTSFIYGQKLTRLTFIWDRDRLSVGRWNRCSLAQRSRSIPSCNKNYSKGNYNYNYLHNLCNWYSNLNSIYTGVNACILGHSTNS